MLEQARNKITEAPDPLRDLILKLQSTNAVNLAWSSPTVSNKKDKEIWYYKIFRDNQLLVEIDGDVNSFNDPKVKKGSSHRYHIVAVNYNFKESKPSSTVSVTVP